MNEDWNAEKLLEMRYNKINDIIKHEIGRDMYYTIESIVRNNPELNLEKVVRRYARTSCFDNMIKFMMNNVVKGDVFENPKNTRTMHQYGSTFLLEKVVDLLSDQYTCSDKKLQNKMRDLLEKYNGHNFNFELINHLHERCTDYDGLDYATDFFLEHKEFLDKYNSSANFEVLKWLSLGNSEDLVVKYKAAMEKNIYVGGHMSKLCKFINYPEVFDEFLEIAQTPDFGYTMLEFERLEDSSDEVYSFGCKIMKVFDDRTALNKFVSKYLDMDETDHELLGRSKALFSEKSLKVIDQYKQFPNFIKQSIEYAMTKHDTLYQKRLERLENDVTWKLYDKPEKIVDCLSQIPSTDVIHFFKKYHESPRIYDTAKLLIQLKQEGKSTNFIRQFIDTFEHYIDIPGALEFFKKNVRTATQLNLLDSPSNHLFIKKYPESISDIFNKTFQQITKHFSFPTSYNNLKLIKKTYDTVMRLHERRSRQDKQRITKGFFDELKRSYSQGGSEESKEKMVRMYCIDVNKQIKDNAEELMLIK